MIKFSFGKEYPRSLKVERIRRDEKNTIMARVGESKGPAGRLLL